MATGDDRPPWADAHDRQLDHRGIWDEQGRCYICLAHDNDWRVHKQVLAEHGHSDRASGEA